MAARHVGAGDPGRGSAAGSAQGGRSHIAFLDAVRAGDRGELCAALMEIVAVLSAAGVRRELFGMPPGRQAASSDAGAGRQWPRMK